MNRLTCTDIPIIHLRLFDNSLFQLTNVSTHYHATDKFVYNAPLYNHALKHSNFASTYITNRHPLTTIHQPNETRKAVIWFNPP